jgi:hypothetical protein
MKNIIVFISVLLIIAFVGIIWGFYEYRVKEGLTISQTIKLIRDIIKPPQEITKAKLPESTSDKVSDQGKATQGIITPTDQTPITATITEIIRKPYHPPKLLVKPEAQELVNEANQFYDEGIRHLQNTFKKDDSFDKENNLAIESFREALKRYLEAEKIDGESLWLRNRIRDTNQNLVTCRKQTRGR